MNMNDNKPKGWWCDPREMHWGKRKIINLVIFLIIIWVVASLFNYGYRGNKQNQQDTIVVSGKGEVVVKPDIATVDFSVMSENLDVSKASDAVNTQVANIVNTLKADGVSEDDIKTTDYSVYPRYDYVNNAPNQAYPYPGGKQVLAGYDVTQSIEVKIRDLSKAGKIITDLGTLKVTNMGGLNFTNDKYDDLVRQARDMAIADARDQAQKLAKALGVKLVKIVGYSEGGSPIYYSKAVPMASGVGGGPEAVIPTGENKIDSNISITYEIK